MKTSPIIPATIEWRDGVPFAPEFGDFYHPAGRAIAQPREVFLHGSGLPARWRGRDRFVVLETGFGLGNNFLATWAAWRHDAQRPGRLFFVSIDKHPPSAADMARAHATSPEPALAAQLLSAWPPPAAGLHTLAFEDDHVTLLLALGDLAAWLPELQLQADAIFLDGFEPTRNPAMWDARVLRALARLAAPGSSVATWNDEPAVLDALAGAGFRATSRPGAGGQRAGATAQADAAATSRRHGVPAGRVAHPQARSALVVGAGLAGAAAAWALARQGLQVTVLEAADRPASGASGNPAGLFHGVVHAHDGAHAQLLRAAALRATQVYRPLIESGAVPGSVGGLLRGAAGQDEAVLRVLARSVPAQYASLLSRDQASALAGCPLAGPAWHYPGGGWLSPAALISCWLAGPGIALHTGCAVAALRHTDAGRWQAVDAAGRPTHEADVVVLAAATDTARLLAPLSDAPAWPWRRTRGQVSVVPAPAAAAAGLPRPALPVASGGYMLPLPAALGGGLNGVLEAGLLCGATSQLGDEDPSLRGADHRANLGQVATLTGADAVLPEEWFSAGGPLQGRVGWRLGCDDRLPVLGGVPLPAPALAGARRLEQPRHVPRVAGLCVLTALGSRGITWAPFLGEVLAAGISGTPLPVASSLLDAIDAARFVSRAARRA